MPKKARRRKSPAKIAAYVLLGAMLLALSALMILRGSAVRRQEAVEAGAFPDASPVPPAASDVPGGASPAPGAAAAAESTPDPTPTPTPAPTPEPEPEYFTISMVGDCSMASTNDKKGWAIAIESVINGDHTYPFANTRGYLEDDYLTIANLEGNLSDRYYSSIEWFSFLSPASYVNILTDGSVEFVTLANNHTMDFGQNAYNDTAAVLDAAGVAYAGENETYIYEADGGLRIGIYCMYNRLTGNMLGNMSAAAREQLAAESRELLRAAEASLRTQGAEYLVACLHMGEEGYYEPTEIQTEMCRHAVDSGFDLVYCSHTHRLQPAERYNGGVIFYGMGNWIFGGNTNPGVGNDRAAYDTGIARITVCRRGESVTLESVDFIPCCISSVTDLENFVPNANSLNNYQPTPYIQGGAAWERAMSIINGTYDGANFHTDYGNILAAMNG